MSNDFLKKYPVNNQTALNNYNREVEKANIYHCLSQMVSDRAFDDTTHLGESMVKSLYRQQLEDRYGKNIPINEFPEGHIIIYREIQRLFFEMQDNTRLNNFLQNNNTSIDTCLQYLTQGGQKFITLIDDSFRFDKKGNFIDFNTEERPVVQDKLFQTIFDEFSDYIRRQRLMQK